MSVDNLVYKKIARGSRIGVTVGLKSGATLENWTCKAQLRDVQTRALSVDKIVTEKNDAGDKFVVVITPAETKVTVGKYILGVELENTTDRLKPDEVIKAYEITQEWVY